MKEYMRLESDSTEKCPHTAQGDCRTGIFVITIGVCKN